MIFVGVGKRKVPGFPQRITSVGGAVSATTFPPVPSAAGDTSKASAAPIVDFSSTEDAAAAGILTVAAVAQLVPTEGSDSDNGDGIRMTTTRTVVSVNPGADKSTKSYDYRDGGGHASVMPNILSSVSNLLVPAYYVLYGQIFLQYLRICIQFKKHIFSKAIQTVLGKKFFNKKSR